MQGNPSWDGDELHLFSQTGYNLTIRDNGEVLGTQEDDKDARLKMSSSGDISFVRIQNADNQLYLCFNSHGNLYGEEDPNVEATIFEENFMGSYSAFKSKVYPDWYVGIKKSGRPKNGTKTAFGQKAVKFLPRNRH